MPAAELSIEDLHVEVLVDAGLCNLEAGTDSSWCWHLERQHDFGWSCLVEREQLTVADQTVGWQSPEVGRRHAARVLA